MANFCITHVKNSADGKHIEWRGVREEFDTSVGPMRLVQRALVASLIRQGLATFITRTWNAQTEKWIKGADVHVLEEKYLTTDRNNTKRDNLGRLPLIESELLAN
ncbi:hypothetical protein ABFV43_19430 [Pseudomonas fulva]|uniref:hypothetical protein n=1 Tax=Pseudomonas fulva TaxID=47880 RepID=UPI0034D6DC6C